MYKVDAVTQRVIKDYKITGDKVSAIKYLRNITGAGIYESQQYIEWVWGEFPTCPNEFDERAHIDSMIAAFWEQWDYVCDAADSGHGNTTMKRFDVLRVKMEAFKESLSS